MVPSHIELGVDAETLSLAWELCADAEVTDWSPRSILGLIDENLVQSSVDQYKAFRLLNSDMGKIFFKTLANNRFKVKTEKSVTASKEQWCRQTDGPPDWCFV